MKDLFPGHFKETEHDLREVWDTSLFVFDANILLNLYRYSDITTSEFLRILEKLKERAWLPHRAAEEYLNNRLSVIDQQERSYDETTKSISTLKTDLENARQHPFVNESIMEQVKNVFDILCAELQKNKAIHTKRISNDEIKESISNIFENSVGSPYEISKLEEIIVEGEERYKQKIPPGYKDASKSADSDIFLEKCRKYGDLIVWSQVIDKAIETGKGIVLVTDDKKEDWWEKFKGKTVGPRPELVKEFQERTTKSFHMYQADRFLELARENLDEQVSQEIVEEIREVRRRDMLAQRRVRDAEFLHTLNAETKNVFREFENSKNDTLELQRERKILKQRLKDLNSMRLDVRHKIEYLTEDGHTDSELEPLRNNFDSIDEEHLRISNILNISSSKYKESKNLMRTLERELADRLERIESHKIEIL